MMRGGGKGVRARGEERRARAMRRRKRAWAGLVEEEGWD